MVAEFSTSPSNSQGIRELPTRPNLAFVWLALSGFIWGAPIILSIYLPLAFLELFLAQKSALRIKCRKFRKKVFADAIFAYLRMQKWFHIDADLEELRKLEESQERFLLVSNHRSHLDVFLFISQIHGLQILAKSALFYVPVLGFMMKVTRQIPARKGDFKSLDRAFALIRKRMMNGERILVFPEFTRCEAHWKDVNSYSLLPFQLAKKENIKILPLVVSGTDEIWPRGSLYLRASHRKQKVVALAPLSPGEFSSVDEFRNKVHKLTREKLLEELNT